MKNLLFVRHGETEWNKNNLIQGNLDIPISSIGLSQAKKLKPYLENIPFEKVFSSDLSRARDTAKILMEGRHLTLQEDVRLRERDFGLWQGMSLEDIEEKKSKDFSDWRSNPFNYRVPEGESMKTMLERVFSFLDSIKSLNDGNYLIVTHGGIIKPLVFNLFGISLESYNRVRVNNTSMSLISFDNKYDLKFLNSTPHLLDNLLCKK